jgi:hypothetical protein
MPNITIKIYGESGAAHAHAILRYFGFTTKDETTFLSNYGYDLRQGLTETYHTNDKKDSHKKIGKGWFQIVIPISDELFNRIRAVKAQNVRKKGKAKFEEITLKLITEPVPAFTPAQIPSYATPQERNFYNAINILETELVNFGIRGIKTADVRADYMKTIKLMSDEFIEKVQSGKISPEKGAVEANQLRNVIYEISRKKDYELFRAYAVSIKETPKTFDWFLEKYSQKRFKVSFDSLFSQQQRNDVFFDVVVAAGKDSQSVSNTAKFLGKAGKVCLVASLAISVYNVATAEDKIKTAGREGTGLLGGIAGGAAGGAAAGLLCGPGAPVCSGIGIFVGGAIGAFVATGGYDWLTK